MALVLTLRILKGHTDVLPRFSHCRKRLFAISALDTDSIQTVPYKFISPFIISPVKLCRAGEAHIVRLICRDDTTANHVLGGVRLAFWHAPLNDAHRAAGLTVRAFFSHDQKIYMTTDKDSACLAFGMSDITDRMSPWIQRSEPLKRYSICLRGF